jgi:hypothetical protein
VHDDDNDHRGWDAVENFKLIRKGEKKVKNTVMIDFNDLLNNGAMRTCETFKLFLDTYGSKKVDILDWHKVCVEKGGIHKDNAERYHKVWFKEAFKEERTYKVEDKFTFCGDLYILRRLGGNNKIIMVSDSHYYYSTGQPDHAICVKDSERITDKEMELITGQSNWKENFALVED